MVADKLAGMKEAYEEVTVLGRTEESIRFTIRDSTDHLRYNYFWWFAAPGSGVAKASTRRSIRSATPCTSGSSTGSQKSNSPSLWLVSIRRLRN